MLSLFPLEHYDQKLSSFISSKDSDYHQQLMSPTQQQARLQEFYRHYFDPSAIGLSPWSETYVTQVLSATFPNNIEAVTTLILADFSNQDKVPEQIGYGMNFRPYPISWIEAIRHNINLNQWVFDFNPHHFGISLTNLDARALPTLNPHFYHHQLAGQGYPFDNLQICSVWAGTPVYVIAITQDQEWALVLTPNVIAWVKHEGIGYVDQKFMHKWQSQAKNHLAAITQTQTQIKDQKGFYHFSAYVGSVFPIESQADNTYTLMIPVRDCNHQTAIATAIVTTDQAATMPLHFTPAHFAKVIRSLLGRPYGWGGLNFYNDCSQELKSLYTPFAIWLPHHSSEQANAGTMIDLSQAPMEERIHYLMQNGHKLTTIVSVGGHVFIYVGNYAHRDTGALTIQTYQNVWGLSPADNSRRAVIGGAVFLPLLPQYPEDPRLVSWANKKYFQISYLDQMPPSLTTPPVNIKSLMMPDSITF